MRGRTIRTASRWILALALLLLPSAAAAQVCDLDVTATGSDRWQVIHADSLISEHTQYYQALEVAARLETESPADSTELHHAAVHRVECDPAGMDMPADTVVVTDTVTQVDTVTAVDTVTVVDTVVQSLSSVFDSTRVYDLESLAFQPDSGFNADTVRAILMPFEGGEPHLCAGVSGSWGWYPAAISSTELPTVQTQGEYWPDAECEYRMGSDSTRVAALVGGDLIEAQVLHATDSLLARDVRPWTAPTDTATAALMVSVLSPSTYEMASADVGREFYIDRGYTISALPIWYEGWHLVRTANDDKSSTAADHLVLELSSAATVAVAYDARADSVPDWLAGWTHSGHQIETTANTFDIYERSVGAGQLTLGANEGSTTGARSMYFVLLLGSDGALLARALERCGDPGMCRGG